MSLQISSCLKNVLSTLTILAFVSIFLSITAQTISNDDCVSRMKAAEDAVRESPKEPIAYFRRGLAHNCLATQELTAAIGKSLESAKAKTPVGRDVSAVEFVRQLKVESGSTEKAIADFSYAIKLSPRYKEALMERAIAYLNKGLSLEMESPEFNQIQKKALGDLNKVIIVDPKSTRALKERASIHLNFEEFDLSIADYTKLIGLSPDQYEWYEERGSARFMKAIESFDKREFRLSVNDYTKAISLTKDSRVLSGLYENRADLYAVLDDKLNEAADRKKAADLMKK